VARQIAIAADHPVDVLEFFLQDPSPAAAERFLAFMASLRDRDWTLGPPELVDEQEDASSCRNLGGVLDLYCAHPPWGERLPVDVDSAQFRETHDLLHALSSLSGEVGAFQVWFDGEEIGEVANGDLDRSLQEGLLGEWQRSLEERRGGPTRS